MMYLVSSLNSGKLIELYIKNILKELVNHKLLELSYFLIQKPMLLYL